MRLLDEWRHSLSEELAGHLGVPLRGVEDAVNTVTGDWDVRLEPCPDGSAHPAVFVIRVPCVRVSDDEVEFWGASGDE